MLQWIRDVADFIFLEDAPAPADVIFIPGNGLSLIHISEPTRPY